MRAGQKILTNEGRSKKKLTNEGRSKKTENSLMRVGAKKLTYEGRSRAPDSGW